jgi:predicted Fe-Mo cluster-binding NifX family protein
MKTGKEKEVNIHLGPTPAVDSLAKQLSCGQKVNVEAFRTKRLEKGHYIARSVTIGGKTIELRDKNLQPKWAGPGILNERPKRIAITAVKPSLDATVDPRFGRCAYFVIVDVETGDMEAVKNTSPASGGHAGVESAETIASKGATVLLTGRCGPNAADALSRKGIQVVAGCSGTVREVVKQYKGKGQ